MAYTPKQTLSPIDTAAVSKVPYDLFQTFDRIRNFLSSFETRIHCDLPSVVEGIPCEFLFALKVTVDPAFLKPRRSHEIGQSSSVVSFLIKDRRRFTNDFLAGLLTLAHVVFLVT